MKRWMAALWLVAACLPGMAGAQDSLREQLHELGRRACTQVWEAGGLDGVDVAARAMAAGQQQVVYCDCVGELFEGQTAGPGDEDAEVFLHQLLASTLTTCLAGAALDGEGEDGDLDETDFAFDEGDVRMCQMALDDDLPVPGFNAVQVLAQLARTGQPRQELCTCAARYFSAGGEPLRQALEDAPNPGVVYASTLAGAIATCLLD